MKLQSNKSMWINFCYCCANYVTSKIFFRVLISLTINTTFPLIIAVDFRKNTFCITFPNIYFKPFCVCVAI